MKKSSKQSQKVWSADEIRPKLKEDAKWMVRSLMALARNNKFRPQDKDLLEDLADWWRDNKWFSLPQYETLAKRLPRYATILANLANKGL